MKSSELILAALLVVLVIVVIVVAVFLSKKADKFDGGGNASLPGSSSSCPLGDSASVGGQPAPASSLADAQREAWYQATANGETQGGGDITSGTAGAALAGYHQPSPGINYQDALVDHVADARMKAQHSNWHSDVAPKSQTAMTVDSMDEAAAVSNYNGHGIYAFRFSAPTQTNPLFVTDQDKASFAKQATKFSFGG